MSKKNWITRDRLIHNLVFYSFLWLYHFSIQHLYVNQIERKCNSTKNIYHINMIKINIENLTVKFTVLDICTYSSSTTVGAIRKNSRGQFDPRSLVEAVSLLYIEELQGRQICDRTYIHYLMNCFVSVLLIYWYWHYCIIIDRGEKKKGRK